MFSKPNEIKLAVMGLGYVGLPLALEFAKKYDMVGFDISEIRISELSHGMDRTLEVTTEELKVAKTIKFTSNVSDLSSCNTYIITVPTPIDLNKRPDLTPLLNASETVGTFLEKGNVVIYESTVYPGATEEECVPILEKFSGLRHNQDFFTGYSPERINPGDKFHRLESITKVTSGSSVEVAEYIDDLYASIITAGTHKAPSIRVAEAAKVIENTQRDLNIALINELAIIFNKLGIDTEAVLKAAETKWNFISLRPGLVGGHCIGVDPYYLTHKAEQIGYHPQVILAGRRINDGMGAFVAGQFIKAASQANIFKAKMRVLILGLAFKENCPDLRNSRVVDVISELQDYRAEVDVYDPEVSPDEARAEYGIDLLAAPEVGVYDGIILAVPHRKFVMQSASGLRLYGRPGAHLFYDLKSVFSPDESDLRL
jgi:UDP-N-acetyl-D-glucosamine/UDP-N-acetyl-D-galactosamine dehydrogenase